MQFSICVYMGFSSRPVLPRCFHPISAWRDIPSGRDDFLHVNRNKPNIPPCRDEIDVTARLAEWLRHLTCKPKVRTVIGSNTTLDSLVAVRNSSPGRPVPCEGNLVAAAGSCGGLMVKHPWSLLEIQYGKYGTFRRDLGCARRKFEVCSVQRLASGHFKCAHLETFQIR